MKYIKLTDEQVERLRKYLAKPNRMTKRADITAAVEAALAVPAAGERCPGCGAFVTTPAAHLPTGVSPA